MAAQSFQPRTMKLSLLTAALQELTPRDKRDADPDLAIEDWLEFARRLPDAGIDAVLVSPSSCEQMERTGLRPDRVRHFERGRLTEILGDCDGIVAQGHLANDVLIEVPGVPTAIDLYDPFLVENLAYAKDRRSDPFVNVRHFTTPIVVHGRIFVAGDSRLYAYKP